ncbi:hypothetical protein AAFF_G00234490 [Aldrovandia affinis]|uniref:Uncharacterized protein n=1 Tax=Aldrovandia affinis TaxID=143900 RepID=A0AAD7SWR5_9TELE|nr:hypothetical protein AAFF_G00234490 [Aldrovandia affinis]
MWCQLCRAGDAELLEICGQGQNEQVIHRPGCLFRRWEVGGGAFISPGPGVEHPCTTFAVLQRLHWRGSPLATGHLSDQCCATTGHGPKPGPRDEGAKEGEISKASVPSHERTQTAAGAHERLCSVS